MADSSRSWGGSAYEPLYSPAFHGAADMVELLRTGDMVMLGWLRNRLSEAGIEAYVFDAHTSSLYAGALDAVTARVMVDEADADRARLILAEGHRLGADE